MLADRHHLNGAGGTVPHLREQTGDWRHVAVLERHPSHRGAGGGGIGDPAAVVDGRAQRLLHQDVQVGGEYVIEDRSVGVVRRRDDHRIAPLRRDEVAVVGEGGVLGQTGGLSPLGP